MHTAVTLIIRTLLQMLSENIVTIDVQPLISRDTGQVLFVDFTEATTFDTQSTVDVSNNPTIRNFISEIMLLMPESLHDNIATKIFLQEVKKYPIESKELKKVLIEEFF